MLPLHDGVLFGLFHLTAAQDLFIDSKFLAQRGFTMEPVQQNNTEFVASSGPTQAFQIMPSDNRRACLELRNDGASNGGDVQIYGCNGLEKQLWHFDEGSFQITWAGDRTKCLDAGNEQSGTLVHIWDCGYDDQGNPWDQQTWGFDSDAGTIYLANSAADASLCLQVYGERIQDYTTAMVVVPCSDARAQSFTLQSGITIRSIQQNEMCLDVPGGDLSNGNQLQMWVCNGLATQYWEFDSDSYRIKAASNPDKCVDAGALSSGQTLMIWDCNDNEAQSFGYDADLQSLYLTSSSDASLCVDMTGDSSLNGAKVQVWDCNQCWNQKLQVYGPATLALAKPALTSAVGGCRAFPSPIASDDVFPEDHCQYDSSHGSITWPRFDSEQDLQNDAGWSAYFTAIYGGVPSSGYPICPGAFQFVWKLSAQNAGVVEEPTQCVDNSHQQGQQLPNGYYYVGYGVAEATDVFSFIANSHLQGAAVPQGYWVEVTHTAFSGDTGAVWFYMSVGSGVWYNVGTTAPFHDHSNAVLRFLNQKCADNSNDIAGHGHTECEKNFDAMFHTARDLGYDSLQFTNHYDCTCGPKGPSSFPGGNRQCFTEIVDVRDLDGAATGCAASFKGGWEASADCACDPSFSSNTHSGDKANYANCGAS